VSVRVKRAYEPAGEDDGIRVLVDRYWPRGVEKDRSAIDLWARDIAPSPELIAWFGHRSERWEDFKLRYWKELREPVRTELVSRLKATAKDASLTLVYGARDQSHNNAVALAEYVESREGPRASTPIAAAPDRVESKPDKPFRDREVVNWFFMLFALALPLILLGMFASVTAYGGAAVEGLTAVLGTFFVATIIRAVRRDQRHLRALLADGHPIASESESVLVALGSLAGQTLATVGGVLVFVGTIALFAFHAGYFR
jgi:uncharacterized protein YeaO (DUF488 family)